MAVNDDGKTGSQLKSARSGFEAAIERFLTGEAAKGVAAFLVVALVVRLLLDIANTYIGTGKPFFADFISFWTAANSAVNGDFLLPYHFEEFSARQVELFERGKFAFFYPPTWLLYLLPFGLLPYEAAVILFEAITLSAACLVLALLARRMNAVWMVFVFPGLAFGVLHGQNSLLNVALFGGALAALDRGRPILAGVLIGLMAYKPHFGVLIPFALLAGREWRAFFAAGVTTVVVALISYAVFGLATWQAFLDQAPEANAWMLEAKVSMAKYASVFGWLRQYDSPVDVAMAAQALVSAVALGSVVLIWSRNVSISIKGAVLVSAACVATPFILDYDLALLAIPLVLIIRQGLETGFLRFECEGLLIASLLMLATNGWGFGFEKTLAPLPPLLFFALSLRRAVVSVTTFGVEAEQGEAALAPAE
ncbi:DUF2029 domain-containing protein [Roseibium polysiphoniae]|uniref:DUF2029 domain-containing protein n=1 Tax=Roseibium polysiphoniae TaxID=2571221 RepID=A0A944CDB0_9HYPH|nr:glycosyltransferase family 87 protein [Roseibium polysiphoniae]MBS8260387.1 DUF2029 domain-containing protein [Roseibium polysiphoniae]